MVIVLELALLTIQVVDIDLLFKHAKHQLNLINVERILVFVEEEGVLGHRVADHSRVPLLLRETGSLEAVRQTRTDLASRGVRNLPQTLLHLSSHVAVEAKDDVRQHVCVLDSSDLVSIVVLFVGVFPDFIPHEVFLNNEPILLLRHIVPQLQEILQVSDLRVCVVLGQCTFTPHGETGWEHSATELRESHQKLILTIVQNEEEEGVVARLELFHHVGFDDGVGVSTLDEGIFAELFTLLQNFVVLIG